jgi:type I restriction enzyme, S subunit
MTRKLVPQLRFPEFRDAGEWEVKPLKSICSMQAGKFVAASDILEKSKGGIYPCYGGNGLRGYTKAHTHTGKYPLIGRQGALCGNVNLANGNFYATEHAVVITPKEDINVDWLFYELDLLNLNRYATGQAQPGLSVEVLEKVQSIVPAKEIEQQKIAECLGSIDDRITLETQKLAALRAHKKGLMQQLFPAEGQTLPQLRFPEFHDSDEWEEKELGEISHKIMVGIASAATYAYRKFGIILFRNQNIKEGYLDDKDILFIDEDYERSHKNKRLKAGDLLTARTGYPGTTCVVPAKYEGSQSFTTLITRPNNSIVDSSYLCIFVNSEKGQAFFNSTKIGGGQKNVNAGSLVVMPILCPSLQEQQKIADCLTSLDELITLQAQAIDALKLHKKGLMQQLFPSVDEVSE